MIKKLFGQKDQDKLSKETMRFDAQIGGYYAYKNEEGAWTIFRLLNFSNIAIDCASYREHFDHKPSLEEAKAIHPFIKHTPLHVGALFKMPELALLGESPITAEDLSGFVYYLQETGHPPDAQEASVKRIAGLYNQGTVTLQLIKRDDRIDIEAPSQR